MASSSAPKAIPAEYSAQLISIADFQIVKLIGQGFCSKVFLAIELRTNTQVALKVIPKYKSLHEWVIQEQVIQASLDEDEPTFLLPLLCSWHDTVNYYLATEYFGGNDMAVELELSTKFSEDRARFYVAELVIALEQLRARGIIHRDIKPGNIIFTKDGHIRLTDFGLSKRFHTTAAKHDGLHANSDKTCQAEASNTSFHVNEVVGTPAYMSIEAHLGLSYSFDVDVHALGVVVYQMLTGKLPFGENAVTAQQLRDAIFLGSFEFETTDNVSEVAQDLISKLLVKNPCDHISLNEIKRHPFFKGLRWDRIKKQTLIAPWKPTTWPLPVSQSMSITHGKPFKISDPYPEFCFTSPRLYHPKKPHNVGFFGKFESLLNSISGENIRPSLSRNKTSITAAHIAETSPPIIFSLGPPILPSISSSARTSSGGMSDSIPAKTIWPPNSVLIIPPTVANLFDRSIPARFKFASDPLCHLSADRKYDPRGRLPRPVIRNLLRSRPHPPTTPRPPFINVFYSTDSSAQEQDLKTPSIDDVSDPPVSSSVVLKHKLPNSPVKRSPLRIVTNSSDCLSPSSAADLSLLSVTSAKLSSDLELESENQFNISIKRPVSRPHHKPAASNTIPTLHIPSPTSKPSRKSSLESLLLPRSTSKLTVKSESEDESHVVADTKNFMEAQVKSTILKVGRGRKNSTLDSDNDDAFFRCRGDPELIGSSLARDEDEGLKPLVYPSPLQPVLSFTTDSKENSQAEATSKIHGAKDGCVRQVAALPDFNNMTPGVYPRALERVQLYSHPALEHAHTKDKPADYPRPSFKGEIDLKHWFPSVEEAFALPPRTAPQPPKYPRRLLLPDILAARAAAPSPLPLPTRKYFDSGSPNLSDEARSRLYGHIGPTPERLSGEEFKAHISETVAQARRKVYMHAESGIFPSALRRSSVICAGSSATPQTIVSGPHYIEIRPPTLPSGPLVFLRRYYVRLLMACGRLLSRSHGVWPLNRV